MPPAKPATEPPPQGKEQLAAIGQLLFGPDWRAPLARILAVQPRTLRRWEKGEAPIPRAAANTIWLLARLHQLEAELAAAKRFTGQLDFTK